MKQLAQGHTELIGLQSNPSHSAQILTVTHQAVPPLYPQVHYMDARRGPSHTEPHTLAPVVTHFPPACEQDTASEASVSLSGKWGEEEQQVQKSLLGLHQGSADDGLWATSGLLPVSVQTAS